MYEELCSVVGEERFDLIRELKIRDVQHICKYAKNCKVCPLALHYTDKLGVPRICCVEYHSRRLVQEVLKEGGHFIVLKGL